MMLRKSKIPAAFVKAQFVLVELFKENVELSELLNI